MNLNENTAGEPQSGNGVPDNVYFCGVRNATISNGGTVLAASPSGVVNGATVSGCTNINFAPAGSLAALGSARCLNPGTAQGVQRIFRFDGSGSLLQDIPAYDFRPFGSGNIIDSPTSAVPGATSRDTGQLAPGLKRFTANILVASAAPFSLAQVTGRLWHGCSRPTRSEVDLGVVYHRQTRSNRAPRPVSNSYCDMPHRAAAAGNA